MDKCSGVRHIGIGKVSRGKISKAILSVPSAPLLPSIVPSLPSAPPLRMLSQTEQIKPPQEVTVEEDRQPSVVLTDTTKRLASVGIMQKQLCLCLVEHKQA